MERKQTELEGESTGTDRTWMGRGGESGNAERTQAELEGASAGQIYLAISATSFCVVSTFLVNSPRSE